MSKVTVTKQFKEDFDTWAADRIKWGDFSPSEMDEFKAMLRQDMAPGKDQLRDGLDVIKAAGVTVPAMIDNHEERIKLWSEFFAQSAKAIRQGWRKAA